MDLLAPPSAETAHKAGWVTLVSSLALSVFNIQWTRASVSATVDATVEVAARLLVKATETARMVFVNATPPITVQIAVSVVVQDLAACHAQQILPIHQLLTVFAMLARRHVLAILDGAAQVAIFQTVQVIPIATAVAFVMARPSSSVSVLPLLQFAEIARKAMLACLVSATALVAHRFQWIAATACVTRATVVSNATLSAAILVLVSTMLVNAIPAVKDHCVLI